MLICRLYTRAFWGDREFMLVDTGGLMSDATKLPKELQASRIALTRSTVLDSARWIVHALTMDPDSLCCPDSLLLLA